MFVRDGNSTRDDGHWRTQGGSGSAWDRGGEGFDPRCQTIKAGVTGRRGGGLNQRRRSTPAGAVLLYVAIMYLLSSSGDQRLLPVATHGRRTTPPGVYPAG